MTGDDQGGPERRLDEAALAFLRAAELGPRPDPADWLRRHPELEPFLAGLGRVEALLAPFRAAVHKSAAGSDVTIEVGAAAPPAAAPVSAAPRSFGPYELLEKLGEGGRGVV